MLGSRLATAINNAGTRFVFTVTGYLITSGGDNFVDSSGNKFIYVQR